MEKKSSATPGNLLIGAAVIIIGVQVAGAIFAPRPADPPAAKTASPAAVQETPPPGEADRGRSRDVFVAIARRNFEAAAGLASTIEDSDLRAEARRGIETAAAEALDENERARWSAAALADRHGDAVEAEAAARFLMAAEMDRRRLAAAAESERRRRAVAADIASRRVAPPRHSDAEWRAMNACKAVIREAAAYKVIRGPNNQVNTGAGDVFQFVWPSGSFVLQNVYGAEVQSTARCSGSLRRCKITAVLVNGQSVLSGPIAFPCGE